MRTLLFAVFGLVLGAPVHAQTFGSISGETRDPTGAVIPSVQLTAIHTQTNATRVVTSNEAGAYAFPSLPPGTYSLKVEKAGFKSAVRNNVELQVQQNARIDFDLPVGQVSDSVDVSANAALLATEDASVGTVIE